MLMTLKNRILLSMDLLILETKRKHGVPKHILLEPQECADFLIELKESNSNILEKIRVEYKNGTETNIKLLLAKELTKINLSILIKEWYKNYFCIFYNGIKIKVKLIKKKEQ